MPLNSCARIAVFLSCLLLASCSGSGGGDSPSPSADVEELLGKRAVEILKKAKEVEVYRIDPKSARDEGKEEKRQTIHEYPVLTEGKKQGEAFVKRTRALLFSDKTYLFELAKGCKFSPGVVLRFCDGKEQVDVLLCFSCDELRVLTVDADGKVTHDKTEDFDPARLVLVELAKEAFPDDAVIQGLKAKSD